MAETKSTPATWTQWPPAMEREDEGWWWLRDSRHYLDPVVVYLTCNQAMKINVYFNALDDLAVDWSSAEIMACVLPANAMTIRIPQFNPTIFMNPQIEAEIIATKTLRRDIDDVIQRVKALSPSAERTLSMRKLQEGVMWLGMDLKRINESNPGAVENPYPNSKDPSNTKIDPTADGLKL